MYFRIIIKQNGAFVFRTSKIGSAAGLRALLPRVRAGFPADEMFTIEVLRAAPSTGETLSDAQVEALLGGAAEPDEGSGLTD